MKEFSRAQRVSGLVQRELADIIQREMSDPALGLVTISAVKLSPDLKMAQIYVTFLGTQLSVQQALHRLNDWAGLLRHQLSQRLTTRTTPRLQFVHDESIEYGIRLCHLIDSVAPPPAETKPPSDEEK